VETKPEYYQKMRLSNLKSRSLWPGPALILIALIVTVIYSNIYHSPFVFDDIIAIAKNPKLRDLANYLSLGQILKPRAIVYLTFAINFGLGELNVFGYHLVNVTIHIINGFVVYFLALTIFNLTLLRDTRSNYKPGYYQQRSNSVVPQIPDSLIRIMALFTALIFIAHPIQTQAVTYTIQRSTAMAAMFYMASVLFYLKARIIAHSSKGKSRVLALYALCIACGILAFLSKQNTASLPGVILLVEYLFIDRTWQGWKMKMPYFALACLFWTLFILYVFGFFAVAGQGRGLLEDASRLTFETKTVSRWSYLCTQFNVLVIYIRLLLLPIHQNLDYLYPFKRGFFDGYTPLAFLFLMGIIGVGMWNIKKRPVIGLGIFWFFITLSVESSIIPIRDALFEHRLYLPMFGFSVAIIYVVFQCLTKKVYLPVIVSSIAVISLGTATYLRNRVWQDPVTLWSDVVSKNPRSYRGQNNLGLSLAGAGRTNEAISHYSEALRLRPDYVEAQNNLGLALASRGRAAEAVKHYAEALRLNPNDADLHNNLGNALASLGRFDDAISHYSQALSLNPSDAHAQNNLANALLAVGRVDQAILHYSQALRLNPDSAQVHTNLGLALARQGRITEAISHYSAALRTDPGYARAHNCLGVALIREGKTKEAIIHFREALKMRPDYAGAYHNLKKALATQQGKAGPLRNGKKQ